MMALVESRFNFFCSFTQAKSKTQILLVTADDDGSGVEYKYRTNLSNDYAFVVFCINND
jgi:hypothetical protein